MQRQKTRGRWGSSPQALAKEPSALWTLSRGDCHRPRARLAEGEPGWGHGAGSSTLFIGCAATRNMRGSPYPSRHSRDTFPAGEGGWVARSALVERGGDLLRRPTEAAHAPPAMEPIRINQQSRSVRERAARANGCRSMLLHPLHVTMTTRGVRGGNAPWPCGTASRLAFCEA